MSYILCVRTKLEPADAKGESTSHQKTLSPNAKMLAIQLSKLKVCAAKLDLTVNIEFVSAGSKPYIPIATISSTPTTTRASIRPIRDRIKAATEKERTRHDKKLDRMTAKNVQQKGQITKLKRKLATTKSQSRCSRTKLQQAQLEFKLKLQHKEGKLDAMRSVTAKACWAEQDAKRHAAETASRSIREIECVKSAALERVAEVRQSSQTAVNRVIQKNVDLTSQIKKMSNAKSREHTLKEELDEAKATIIKMRKRAKRLIKANAKKLANLKRVRSTLRHHHKLDKKLAMLQARTLKAVAERAKLGTIRKLRNTITKLHRSLNSLQKRHAKPAATKKEVREIKRQAAEEHSALEDEIIKLQEQLDSGGSLPAWISDLKTRSHKKAPYPIKLVEIAQKMMGDGIMASKVESQVRLMLEATAQDEAVRKDMEGVKLPDQTTFRRWRYGMAHLCMVQIGMLLTAAATDRKQVLVGDGTPVEGKHVENFVINTSQGEVCMIPWVQAGKTSKLSAQNYALRLKESQLAYNEFYAACEDHQGLPEPVELGSFLFNIASALNDHAANETARNVELSKIKKELAECSETGNVDGKGDALKQFYCSHHKLMLWAKAIRQADHKFVTELAPDRDSTIREFRTSNVLDMLQLQVKLFRGKVIRVRSCMPDSHIQPHTT